jgi:CheY-like chemotaxis protein
MIGENVELDTRLAPDLGRIRADSIHLDQVIMNLAANACKAMSGWGRLSIETANVVFDENYCAAHPDVQPGPYVMLAVSDNGVGMDDPGRGPGPGLSIVYEIVKRYGGEVMASSGPRGGTSFAAYFPAEGHWKFAAAETCAAEMRGSETILACEDEDRTRNPVHAMLKRQGYRVLTASSAGEALRISAKQRIDLLLTDIAVDRSGGFELAGRLRAEQPGMKALYLSSGAEGRVKGASGREDLSFFLRKPFTEGALAQKVREALGPALAALD